MTSELLFSRISSVAPDGNPVIFGNNCEFLNRSLGIDDTTLPGWEVTSGFGSL